ncbi:MAG TPA: VWA domain-containing protein [Thermoanaerobaculia bacterium]|nr:VWA domain-containing protein [Thermoanaerobaculia bacterium]
MRRFAIVFAMLVLALPSFAQQQQPFQERVDVNVVLLDVIVTDAKGNQILGLSKDDFIVKENGVEQPVETIDYFTNRQLLDARESNAPFKVENVREERYFIFFFDKPTDNQAALFDQLTVAREAARKFIREEMRPGDRVAVAAHDVRLKIFSDFTSDKAQLEKAINDSARFGRGLERPTSDNGILQNLSRDEMIKRTGRVYEAIRVLADALRPIRGRKNLVLFSPGIVEQDETVNGGIIVNRSRYLDPMLEALNAANVTVYPLQLQRDPDTTPLFHQRLEEMAQVTGGQYFRFNTSFVTPLDRIENVNNGYYLLTYRSRKAPGERGFQKVSVSVKNPEFRVVARSGYQYGG